jgi:MFS transporter, MFS domain-containing protein family, molybdate-anion transporter
LYVLYESYGFSAASLYCTGFVAGAITAPITGPLIDKFGRKRSALIYCSLEIGINVLEQYPFFVGIVFSRIMGGVTTNLLSSVFETWLDTEYCRRGFEKSQYEIILRDAVVVKNLAAIASGYLAHILAEHAGPVGPFRGAVLCTAVALVVIGLLWTENFGCGGREDVTSRSLPAMMKDIVTACKSDLRVLRVGVIQGLTMATLFIFVFLWVPILQGLAKSAPAQTMGLDSRGEPAYGLIFGAFMAAGVLGGVISPYYRRSVAFLLSPLEAGPHPDIEREDRPLSVELVATFSYILASIMLLVPCMVQNVDPTSFSRALGAFVLYELLIGLYMPCEGIIRSLYIPSDSRGSLMTIPNVVVNVLVVVGVVSSKFVS